jgi:hypothetical protein
MPYCLLRGLLNRNDKVGQFLKGHHNNGNIKLANMALTGGSDRCPLPVDGAWSPRWPVGRRAGPPPAPPLWGGAGPPPARPALPPHTAS